VGDLASEDTRTIIASTMYGKPHAEGLGFARPVAEIVGDKLQPIDIYFCQTGKVFITGGYMDLEKRYPNQTLFRLTVSRNSNPSENVDPEDECRYVAHYAKAEPLKNRELFEVISAPLPDSSLREIQVARLPGTNFIFIEDATDVYGPFKWSAKNNSQDEITLAFIDSKLPSVVLGAFMVYRIERSKVMEQAITVGEGKVISRLLSDLGVLQNAQLHDYASDEDLVRFAGKLSQESNLKLIEKSKFDNLIALLSKQYKASPQSQQIRARLSRLSSVIANSAAWQGELTKEMGEFFKGERGRAIVTSHIDSNQNQYLESLRKKHETELSAQLETINQEIRAARQRLGELEEEKKNASAEVESKRREAKATVNLDAEYARLDEQMTKRRDEIEELEMRLAERIQQEKALANLDYLRAESEKLQGQQVFARELVYQAKNELADVQREINANSDQLRRKLMGYKSYVDALNGLSMGDEVEITPILVPIHASKSQADLVSQQRDVIAAVHAKLSANGRPLEEWQIVNLLISTQQSFLTVFAGLPGVGKTSLARLLPDSLGLGIRLNEISVARGWTSQKDLIGFHNPLANRFQPSSTGMYNFLRALHEEAGHSDEHGMAYALLDEANLSPIEHYWSGFMTMADGGGTRQLTLGEIKVQIPDHLRFLATINYDGTTEPLSPRVTDRAVVILLEPTDPEVIEQNAIELVNALPISAQRMTELFGNELVAPELSADELQVFNVIRRTLSSTDAQQGVPISISARKIIAIRQYCAKARGILGAANDNLLALDVAIKQHVLPQVRGNGRFGSRLKQLLRDLDSHGLRGSAEIIRRMIDMGESDLQSYDFFYW
jgi:hypothetical protein